MRLQATLEVRIGGGPPEFKERVRADEVIAHEHHVATGSLCRVGAGHDVARRVRPGHRQIVAEDRSIEAQATAQDLLQPDARKSRGLRVHGRIDDVRRHHAGDASSNEYSERHEVIFLQCRQRTLVDGNLVVRIRGDESVAWKMFRDTDRSSGPQSATQRAREMRHGVGIAMQRPIADDAARAIVEVEHRGKAEIDSLCNEFAGNDAAQPFGFRVRRGDVAIPQLT